MHKRNMAHKTARSLYRIVIGQVNIQPHSFAKLHVGMYEGRIPTPHFVIATKPEIGKMLSAKLERSDENGNYALIYFFQNFGGQACKVTVRAEGTQYGNSGMA